VDELNSGIYFKKDSDNLKFKGMKINNFTDLLSEKLQKKKKNKMFFLNL